MASTKPLRRSSSTHQTAISLTCPRNRGSSSRLKRTRIRRSEQEWSKILARFDRVELSHRELCQRDGLALSTFQWWWRRKLGRVHRGRKSHDSAWFVALSEETCCPATFSPRHCATPRIARPDYGISSYDAEVSLDSSYLERSSRAIPTGRRNWPTGRRSCLRPG